MPKWNWQDELAKRDAEIERLRAALRDCLDWMESGRASTDWGFWDWKPGDEYTRAMEVLNETNPR